MEYPGVQLLIYLIITFCDVGTAIHNRHVLKLKENTGYAAHFAGALAGLLVGIYVVRNINVTRTERIIWWVSIITYVLLMGIAIVWNIVYTDYFPPQDHNK